MYKQVSGEIFFSNFLDRVIYRTVPVSYIIQRTVSQKITIFIPNHFPLWYVTFDSVTCHEWQSLIFLSGFRRKNFLVGRWQGENGGSSRMLGRECTRPSYDFRLESSPFKCIVPFHLRCVARCDALEDQRYADKRGTRKRKCRAEHLSGNHTTIGISARSSGKTRTNFLLLWVFAFKENEKQEEAVLSFSFRKRNKSSEKKTWIYRWPTKYVGTRNREKSFEFVKDEKHWTRALARADFSAKSALYLLSNVSAIPCKGIAI